MRWFAVANPSGWEWELRSVDLPRMWGTTNLKVDGMPLIVDTPALTVSWRSGKQSIWARTWLPTYVFGALAVLPWIKWRPRFRLRTMLVATTVVAVLVAIVAAG
jgi:hypothetical protein